MSRDIIDLEEIVRNWALRVFQRSSDGRETLEILPSDIDWSELRIRHEPTNYSDQIQSASPKTQVLFTAQFKNETEHPQVFVLKSARKTTSVSSVSVEKAITKGVRVDLKIQPPNPVVEANAGLKGEVSITDSNVETFEEQMTWSVNNDVRVPPKQKITAELVLTEVEYSSMFTCNTRLSGSIRVFMRPKRSTAWNISTHVHKIFQPEHGFERDGDEVYFMSKGSCKCRFGLEQHVRLQQTSL